jgi:GTPase involved in cell partitioning and DNA repair
MLSLLLAAAAVPKLMVLPTTAAAAAWTADVPGLLEGAHEGHGLGHAFLRHISRCRVLLHLLDGTSPDPIGDYKAIQLELELFNPALLEKPQVIALLLLLLLLLLQVQ